MQSNFNTIRLNTISGVSNGVNIGEAVNGTWSGRNYFTNDLESNNIGTDPTGSFVIGNDSDGVFLGAVALENFLGPFNVISGMSSSGIELLHASNYGNIIIANLIGTNREGTTALGNGELGVLIANGAVFNDVGGPSGGNVISGNRLGGVVVGTPEFPAPCTRIYVESNLIGTDATGLRVIGNQTSGITSQNASETIMHRNVIGWTDQPRRCLKRRGSNRPRSKYRPRKWGVRELDRCYGKHHRCCSTPKKDSTKACTCSVPAAQPTECRYRTEDSACSC